MVSAFFQILVVPGSASGCSSLVLLKGLLSQDRLSFSWLLLLWESHCFLFPTNSTSYIGKIETSYILTYPLRWAVGFLKWRRPLYPSLGVVYFLSPSKEVLCWNSWCCFQGMSLSQNGRSPPPSDERHSISAAIAAHRYCPQCHNGGPREGSHDGRIRCRLEIKIETGQEKKYKINKQESKKWRVETLSCVVLSKNVNISHLWWTNLLGATLASPSDINDTD